MSINPYEPPQGEPTEKRAPFIEVDGFSLLLVLLLALSVLTILALLRVLPFIR